MKRRILSYYPKMDSDEKVDVGYLLYDQEKNKMEMIILDDLSQLEKYNVDVNFIKQYLQRLKKEVDKIDTLIFVNSLRFSKEEDI